MRPDVRMAADIGGTFTDIVLDRGTERLTRKVLTTAQRPEEGVLDGARLVLADAGLHFSDIDVFIHGTTLATNAIIERRGARTALIATEGFRDTLDIANESRYDQYDLTIEKPQPLVPRALRFTVPERVDVHGKVRLALDEAAVAAQVARLKDNGIEAVAICFMHSYVNAAHEQRTAEILKAAMPGLSITLSSEVCPEIREYERTSTAVANAYVQPLMDGYLARMDEALRVEQFRGAIYLVTSGGGLTSIDTARKFPVRLVEVRAGGRRDLRRAGGGARRREEGAVVRHGRHHGEDLPDRELRAEFGARLRGRSRGALPQRLRPAGAHSGDRDGGDRRRRRLDRACRCAEARHGRAGKRRLRAGPGLLPARRPAADRHRRGCGARHDRSGGVRGRHDLAQSGSRARRARGGGRRSARAVARDRRLRGARDGVREHGERRARARGRARRGGERSHADRVRRRGAAACGAGRREARARARAGAAQCRRRLGGRIPGGADFLRAGEEPPHAARQFRFRRRVRAARRDGEGCARAGRAGRARRAGHRAAPRLHALCRAGARDHGAAAGARPDGGRCDGAARDIRAGIFGAVPPPDPGRRDRGAELVGAGLDAGAAAGGACAGRREARRRAGRQRARSSTAAPAAPSTCRLYRRERMEPGARVAGPGDHRRGRDLDIRHRELRCAHRRGRVYRDGAEGELHDRRDTRSSTCRSCGTG